MTTKQTVKKEVSAKALAPLLAGLLLVSIFALALISGSLLTPATAKAFSPKPSISMTSETVDGNVYITATGIVSSFQDSPMLPAKELTKISAVANKNLITVGKTVTFPLSILENDSFRFSLTEYFPDFDFLSCKLILTVTYDNSQSFFTELLIVPSRPLPPDPTKEGYTFTGWYLDEACTEKYNGTEITSDITLYAGWQINRYTVIIDKGDGTEKETRKVDWNTLLDLTAPERTGYEFLGWFIDGGDTEYTGEAVKADVSITARWQRKSFTVTFMVDGSVYKTLTVMYGETLADVMAKNGLAYYNVQSVAGANGSLEDFNTVLDDTVVTIAAQKGFEKSLTFLKTNWLWFAVIGGGAVLLTIIGSIVLMGFKKKKMR